MYKGIIVFMLCDEKSKSECLQPFLYLGEGKFIRVWKKGDNPFEHASFQSFDGKQVMLIGELDENDEFCVTEIQEINTQALVDETEDTDNNSDVGDKENEEMHKL